MAPESLEHCYAELGATPGLSAEELQRLYLQRSYAAIKDGASDETKARLRAARDAVLADISARQPATRTDIADLGSDPTAQALGNGEMPEVESNAAVKWRPDWVAAVGAPSVIFLAVLLRLSFAGFLFEGFHVWVHEFGHATIAWLTGHRALPLPIGWTNIASGKSLFVYFGVLFLLAVLGVAGWRERKWLAVGIAVATAGLQFYTTWLMSPRAAQLWISFGGVGGEFYLSAAMVGLFFFELPEKFRWSLCRWVFLFIGAASFSQTFLFWRAVRRGAEVVPYGTLINGEDDANGDMDALRDDYHWSERHIIHTYNHLGTVCIFVVAVIYLIIAFRLYRLVPIATDRLRR